LEIQVAVGENSAVPAANLAITSGNGKWWLGESAIGLVEYSDLDASYAREKKIENWNTVSQYMGMYSLEKTCLRSGT
jgi:hypothetical protein